MSMQDPIADMLCRIRNAQQARHQQVAVDSSNIKENIAKVLMEQGYIIDYHVETHANNKKTITLDLKYYQDHPVISRIKRISRPGLRIYKSPKDLTSVAGFGIAILTTSKGVMTHTDARINGVGGEIICEVA